MFDIVELGLHKMGVKGVPFYHHCSGEGSRQLLSYTTVTGPTRSPHP